MELNLAEVLSSGPAEAPVAPEEIMNTLVSAQEQLKILKQDLVQALVEQVNQQIKQPESTPTMSIIDVKVTDENVALNLLVSFISLAQTRGVFSIQESAKIWECISTFSKSGAK